MSGKSARLSADAAGGGSGADEHPTSRLPPLRDMALGAPEPPPTNQLETARAGDPPPTHHHHQHNRRGQRRSSRKAEQRDKRDRRQPSESSSSSSADSGSESSGSGEGGLPRRLARHSGRRHRGAYHHWGQPGCRVTASYRQLDTLSSTHQYTISGFELARSMGCGSRICSDYFEVAGQYFRLEVYPAGYTIDLQKYVSVYLTTPTPAGSPILHEVSVTDQSGKGKHITRASKRRIEPMLAMSGVVAAYPCFVKARRLEEHARRYLLHDTLVIRATVDVVHSWRSVQAPQLAAPAGPGYAGHMPGSQPPGHHPSGHPAAAVYMSGPPAYMAPPAGSAAMAHKAANPYAQQAAAASPYSGLRR